MRCWRTKPTSTRCGTPQSNRCFSAVFPAPTPNSSTRRARTPTADRSSRISATTRSAAISSATCCTTCEPAILSRPCSATRKVAKPMLERAFHETYGLEMKDVFISEDLAISTYRHSVSQTIPQITKIAWRDKQEEIARLTPGVRQEKFVFTLTRRQYEQEFGVDYRKPGLYARFLGVLYRLLPKVGPLRPLSFKAPTPQT